MDLSLRTAWHTLDDWLEGPASLMAQRWRKGRPSHVVQARMEESGKAVFLRSGRKRGAGELTIAPGQHEREQGHVEALSSLINGRHVELSTPRAWVIERRIELPLEAGEHLDGIVASRIASLSPLPAQDTLYGHRVATRDKAATRISVDIALIPKGRVAAALDIIEAAGARSTEVIAHTSHGTTISLYPRRTGRHGALGRIKLVLAIALIASVTSAGVALGARTVYGMNKAAQRTELEARAATARATIGEIMAPQEAGTAPEQAALQIKNEAVSALGALDDLAEALPAHSFATEITLMDGRLRLAGRTYDLPDVLTALESSGRFAESALVGPAVRGEDERSSLFTLETRPLIRTGGALQ